MRTNTWKNISQLTLTIAVSLVACTVEEEPNQAPVNSLSGADGTGGGTGGETDTGSDDGSGETAGGSGADDDSGGGDCSLTKKQYGCVGVAAVIYCGADTEIPCRLAPPGESVPRICTYGVETGGANLEEMIVCETIAASEGEVLEECEELADGITIDMLNRPLTIEVGNETWAGEVVWIPSGEDNPYNGAIGFCQNPTSDPVFPLADEGGFPVPCDADQCVPEAIDCTGYDISGASAKAERGSNVVYASISLDKLDALRADTGLGDACDKGLYAFVVDSDGVPQGGYFKNVDNSTLYGSLGFRNGDELRKVTIDDASGNEEVLDMISFENAIEVVSQLPEPGNYVHMRFEVERRGKTVYIDFETTE